MGAGEVIVEFSGGGEDGAAGLGTMLARSLSNSKGGDGENDVLCLHPK